MERSTPLKETIENDREEEYQTRFWAQRPEGIVLDKEKEFCYVLKFKRKMDRWMGYSTAPRNGNPVEICLSSPQKNGN